MLFVQCGGWNQVGTTRVVIVVVVGIAAAASVIIAVAVIVILSKSTTKPLAHIVRWRVPHCPPD